MPREFTLRLVKWLGQVQIHISLPESWIKSRPF